MTWTKLSDDFGDQCAALSDAAFRTHVEGLLWTMRRETGGQISARDLRRFAETHDPDVAAAELVAVGWWKPEPNGWRIAHHMEHQPEPDLIARRRELDAGRQRRHRRRKAGLDRDDAAPESRRDSTRDTTRDPGRVGTGRDGTGKSSNEEQR